MSSRTELTHERRTGSERRRGTAVMAEPSKVCGQSVIMGGSYLGKYDFRFGAKEKLRGVRNGAPPH